LSAAESGFTPPTDGLCQVLPPGGGTIEEVWVFLQGEGEMWRGSGEAEEICRVGPGVFLTIPTGTALQFRAVGDEPVRLAMATMPRWPGPDEAVPAEGPSIATEFDS